MIAGEDTSGRGGALESIRAGIVVRLRARLPEVERAIFAGLRDGRSEVGRADAEYVEGLRVAIIAVLDHVLIGMEKGGEWSGLAPPAAIAQARLAARNGVGLETVLLRYTAGSRLLSGFVMDESDSVPTQVLRQVLNTQGLLVERLMATVSTEYNLEVERMGRSLEQRRGERIQSLLASEPVDLGEFDYDFQSAWHIGLIAVGVRAREAVRGLGGSDLNVLLVSRGEKTVWGWLGSESRLPVANLERRLSTMGDMGVSLAIGEPSQGIDGWRLTHNQAQSALLVGLHRPQGITRYVEDMLLAAALQDETLATSLQEIYMSPLADQRDGGLVLRETLRVYFEVTGNAATAAVRLKVNRHTVERRLQKIEERLGRLLPTCQAELKVALGLHELGPMAVSDRALAAAIQSPGGSH